MERQKIITSTTTNHHAKCGYSRKKEGMNECMVLNKVRAGIVFLDYFTFSASLGTIVHCWPS